MIYTLEGQEPQINDNAWIAPTAVLIGNVVLLDASSVWFGAVLRGDNEQILVGAGSNVQENAVLHTDMGFPMTIGSNCTVGHKALLHGCEIGDNCLIGMGATVMNGAKIGKNCLIGAGALITEGKVIPDGAMVLGSPAKVVRELSQEAINGITDSAVSYQRNARRYRDGLVLKNQ